MPEKPVTNEKQTETKPPTPEVKCLTKWEALNEAGLVPTELVCQSYSPIHRIDTSCHTRLLVKPESVLSHMNPDHSAGGFQVTCRQSESKKSDFWTGLVQAGIELQDFRCDVCDKEVPLVPRRLLAHMKPHAGKSNRTVQGGQFNFTVSFDPPMEGDDEEF